MKKYRDGETGLDKGIHVRKSQCNSKHTSGDAKEEDQVIRRYHVVHIKNIKNIK